MPAAQYYQIQGIAGIHGKIYGSVDFAIIKVSVSIEAYAYASVLMEAYKATLLRLNAEVSVHAKVSFLFFSIHFSFSVSLDISFTVGSDRQTPWIVDSSANTGTQSFGLPYATRAGVYALAQPKRDSAPQPAYLVVERPAPCGAESAHPYVSNASVWRSAGRGGFSQHSAGMGCYSRCLCKRQAGLLALIDSGLFHAECGGDVGDLLNARHACTDAVSAGADALCGKRP